MEGEVSTQQLTGTGDHKKEENKQSKAAFFKIKQSLSSNFYSCLSLPTCQVEEREPSSARSERHVHFSNNISPTMTETTRNKIAARWERKIQARKQKKERRNKESIVNMINVVPPN
jgi:hypothetical protein